MSGTIWSKTQKGEIEIIKIKQQSKKPIHIEKYKLVRAMPRVVINLVGHLTIVVWFNFGVKPSSHYKNHYLFLCTLLLQFFVVFWRMWVKSKQG